MHCTGCDVAAHDADSETKKEETKDNHTFLMGDKEVPDIKSIRWRSKDSCVCGWMVPSQSFVMF